ncbi:MAG: YbjN domain-containing protein [Actinomycetaceae bacterium]|nr:YbjN domain-containing protein [Actinomycetaceae bacterium]
MAWFWRSRRDKENREGADEGVPVADNAGKIKKFKKPISSIPEAVTNTRIRETLEAIGLYFLTDPDGDLYFRIDGSSYYIFLDNQGSTLVTRGIWYPRAPVHTRMKLARIANSRNERAYWPTCSLRVDDSGGITLLADTAVPVSDGLSDRQLRQCLECGINSTVNYFRELEDAFPETRFGDDPLMGGD